MSLPVQSLDAYSSVIRHRGLLAVRYFLWYMIFRPLVSSYIPGSYWRTLLLRLFGSQIGINCRIKPRVCITYPWNLTVGEYCWLGEGLWIDNLTTVVIGSHVCLSQGSYLCTGNHNYRQPSFTLRLGAIHVCSEAWIAANSVLAPGVTIGSGAVVSLGSVVLADVPQNAIVRGNPAFVVGQR